MTRHRWLVVGLALLALPACSNKNDKITAVGSYAPVITGLSMNHEPAVRGIANQLTVLVTNVNGFPLAYHWKAGSGVLAESTSATVTWNAPDSIGTFDVYVSVEGTDPNEMYYFRERTFRVYVDNDFERWTSGEAVKFDVAPPGNQAPDATHPLLYAEFENPSTGESHVVAVSQAMGAPTPLSDGFFAAASPTLRADGSQIAFAGRARSVDAANSIYLIPASGAPTDTTNAIPVARYRPLDPISPVLLLANPRFARSGTMLSYNSDSSTAITSNFSPHVYVRDAGNFGFAPQAVVTGFGDINSTYWTPNWDGTGDSLICESYDSWNTIFETQRGIYKLFARPPFQALGVRWLADPDAREVEWSPDNQFVAYTRRNQAGDRDIWIIRSDATAASEAIRVTYGPADDGHPRFSSDANTIFFISNRADRYGLNGVFGTQRRGYNIWAVSRFDRP